MEIRKAKVLEISEIKKLIDSTDEMDTTVDTFTESYFKRIQRYGIILVAVDKKKIVGTCFGTFNLKEKWADLLGLAVRKEFRKKGVGYDLVKSFEKEVISKKKISTIDLYADKLQINLFKKNGYKQGRTYIAFRKVIKDGNN